MVLCSLGRNQEIDEMIRMCDTDGDGQAESSDWTRPHLPFCR